MACYTAPTPSFGKNSDRSPNEAQVNELYPARVYDGGEVACTYRLIPQARETLGVLLSRPAWMWGAEIGVNEAGVAIGKRGGVHQGKIWLAIADGHGSAALSS